MTEASIVFRKADMTSTRKIYVDKMSAALELAAHFRNASAYVDIITPQDEVAYRWKNGVVEWDQNDAALIASETDPYDFVRSGDRFWVAEYRLRLLHDVLEYVLELAKGRENQEALDALAQKDGEVDFGVWALIQDARDFAILVSDKDQGFSKLLDYWVMNSKHTFIHYRVEYIALCMDVDFWI